MAKFTIDGITYEGTPAELAEMVREFAKVDAESKEVPVVETLEIGDKVIVSGLSIYGADHDGQVGKFEGIDADGDYSVRFPDDYVRLYKRDQLEKVTDSTTLTAKVDELDNRVTALEKGEKPAQEIEHNGETYTLVSRKAQAGDVVIPTGDTTSDYVHKDMPYLVNAQNFIEGFPVYRNVQNRTEANVLVYAPKAPRKPKTGDIVVITGNTNGSGNKVGDIGKVGGRSPYSTSLAVLVPGGPEIHVYTRLNEMRLATEAERAQYDKAVEDAKNPKLKVGDYVRVKDGAESRHGDIGAGEIVEVTDDGYSYPYKVRVDLLDGSDYDRFKADDLELVDEKAVTFAKIGREPGEFKKGDIVRAKWTMEDAKYGTLFEIKRGPVGDMSGGNYEFVGGDRTLGKDLELVTPVESRVDNVA